jgi:hypothetical protein
VAKNGSLYDPSRKHKTPKGSSSKDLCALCFLFVHPLAFIRRGSRKRKIFSQKDRRTTNRRDPRERREDENAN